MTLRFMGILLAAAVVSGPVAAEAPRESMRPVVRPGGEAAAEMPRRPVPRPDIVASTKNVASGNPPVEVAPETPDESAEEAPVVEVAVARLAVSPLPVPRPRVVYRTPVPGAKPAPDPASVAAPEKVVPAAARAPTRVTPPRPEKRPRGLFAAIFRAPDKPSSYPREGSVCGDPAIRGQKLPPIPAKLRGCGLSNPVRITAVDGVALTVPATINCQTAGALRHWVTKVVKPAVGRTGGGVGALKVAASYSCRTRNNVPGAKISEHGRGNAIDISAIILKDGTPMTVLRGWRHKVQGPVLRAVHAKACGVFGTVLGPNSDRYHQDHFHFDLASHGYGPYCR